MVSLFLLITSEPILDDFFKVWKNPGIQAGEARWPHSDVITHLLRQVTSSPHDTDENGDS